MKLLILIGFISLVVLLTYCDISVAQDATTTNFCADAVDCCTLVALCLAEMNENATTNYYAATPCPNPSCPLGYTLSTSASGCKRIDSKVTDGSNGVINTFTSLSSCLSATKFPQSYHTRHCIEGLNQAKRACLFNLGLKG